MFRRIEWSAIKTPLFILLSLGLMAAGCKTPAAPAAEPEPAAQNTTPTSAEYEVFLSAEAFSALARQGASVVDIRDESAYRAGHFPGAVHAEGGKPWEDKMGMLIADSARAEQLIRDLGIDQERPVIIYGAPRSPMAFRLFWTLEHYGHDAVHIYPAGYPALKDALAFTETQTPATPQAGDFTLSIRPDTLANADEVQASIDDPKVAIIDARTAEEYAGTAPKSTGGEPDPRQGHIPGAVRYGFDNIFDEDGDLRPKEEIRAELEALGVLDTGTTQITYCQTGTRGAVLYALLRWLGESPRLYDGSWAEWSRGDYPVESADPAPQP